MSMYSTNIDAHSLSLYSSLFLMYIYSNPPKDSTKKRFITILVGFLTFPPFFLGYIYLFCSTHPYHSEAFRRLAASRLAGEPLWADAQRDAQEGAGGGSHQGSVDFV